MALKTYTDDDANLKLVDMVQTTPRTLDEIVKGSHSAHHGRHESGGADEIDASGLVGVFSTGMIILWSGAVGAIPAGWVLCDGNNDTPDLRNRFVVGAGDSYAVDVNGGEASHTLTVGEMPAHKHTAQWKKTATAGTFADHFSVVGDWTNAYIGSTGGGGAHENRPPYYALCYIMKT